MSTNFLEDLCLYVPLLHHCGREMVSMQPNLPVTRSTLKKKSEPGTYSKKEMTHLTIIWVIAVNMSSETLQPPHNWQGKGMCYKHKSMEGNFHKGCSRKEQRASAAFTCWQGCHFSCGVYSPLCKDVSWGHCEVM